MSARTTAAVLGLLVLASGTPTSGDGLYEKFMRGEKVNTGWVNPTDFEKGPVKPPLGPS